MSSWILPSLFAAAIAIGVTVAIERFGGRKGGLIGTLPSTIVPASIGMLAASPSLPSFQEALFITPAGMLVNTLFLLMWRLIPPRLPRWSSMTRLAVSVGLSLLGWGALAWCAIRLMTLLIMVLLFSQILCGQNMERVILMFYTQVIQQTGFVSK